MHKRTIGLALSASGLIAAALVLPGLTSAKPAAVAAPLPEQLAVIRTFDQDLLQRFAFGRVIGQLLTTAKIADTPAARQALVKTMIASYSASSFINPISRLPMPVDSRPSEAGLVPAALLDPNNPNGLIPIGIFNRPDLAPADWSDCGEQRIIFSLKPGAPGSRFMIIFEAKLPNPTPKKGMLGCQAVGKRWLAISQAAAGVPRNALLDELFFKGLPGFVPVVHAQNYGNPLGQVRTDNFVGFTKWQLREFRLLAAGPNTLQFLPGPVASNPLVSFYANNPLGPPLEQSERNGFQTAFANTYQVQLRSIDASTSASIDPVLFQEALFNGLGARIDPRFNEFQSDSQGSLDIPAGVAGTQIKARIPANWASPVGARSVSQAQMLNRAGAITCGGCHQFTPATGSNIGTANGQPMTWPQTLVFTHINEGPAPIGTHDISPALKTFFIPFRAKANMAVANGTAPIAAARVFRLTASPAAVAGAAIATRDRPAQDRARAEQATMAILRSRNASPDAVEALALLSEQAHARDIAKPGAFIQFRRPH